MYDFHFIFIRFPKKSALRASPSGSPTVTIRSALPGSPTQGSEKKKQKKRKRTPLGDLDLTQVEPPGAIHKSLVPLSKKGKKPWETPLGDSRRPPWATARLPHISKRCEFHQLPYSASERVLGPAGHFAFIPAGHVFKAPAGPQKKTYYRPAGPTTK